ncbi:MAG TPA: ABC transporter permease [Devosia sp.]|nr:ABC transporter permease [Devosia sp.]
MSTGQSGFIATLRRLPTWELVLVVLLAAIVILNSQLSPYFLDVANLFDSTLNFDEKAMIALPVALVIVTGQIDVSVASIVSLCAVAMGLAANAGADGATVVAAALATGLVAGLVNGLLVTGLRVHSIVVTIGTLSLYRGITEAVVQDGAFTKFPQPMLALGRAYLFNLVPVETVCWLLLAVVFGVILHFTTVGRRIFAIGNNPNAARYSGIAVDRYKVGLFALTGLVCGIAAAFLVCRLGSVRQSIAEGSELQVVTIVVLGGVSIAGGSGTIVGVVLSTLVIGALTYGLNLVNIPGIVVDLCLGGLLIASISVPRIIQFIATARRLTQPT